MNQNYQMVPPVYYQNPLEEKKLFFFRKNCNSVAKALWLNLLLQFALTFVFEFVYIMVDHPGSNGVSQCGRLHFI